jgi:putative transposase
MGLEAVYPKPKLSAPGQGHKVFPYLLRGVKIDRVDQVWSTDITSIPLPSGFLYLAAVIDWFSRYVLAWRLSNTLDSSFCLDMLDEALRRGKPEVFNTDQGVQFTAEAFTGRLLSAGVAVSMDGRGRCLDNVFVERLWRSVKYEDVYLKGYETVPQLHEGLGCYFPFYNQERPSPVAGLPHAGGSVSCVFRGIAPASAGEGEKSPWAQGEAPAARRRPGYPLVGCSPAEPTSVSPGSRD